MSLPENWKFIVRGTQVDRPTMAWVLMRPFTGIPVPQVSVERFHAFFVPIPKTTMIITIEEFYRYSVLAAMDELGVYDEYNFIKIIAVAPTIFAQMGIEYANFTHKDEEKYFSLLLEVAKVMCVDEI